MPTDDQTAKPVVDGGAQAPATTPGVMVPPEPAPAEPTATVPPVGTPAPAEPMPEQPVDTGNTGTPQMPPAAPVSQS